MSNAEIAMLAAKNEYIEQRLDRAVEIIMLVSDALDNMTGAYDCEPPYDRAQVHEDMRTLLFGSEMHPFNYGLVDRSYFQRALDITNLPRILASASSGIVQGTKRPDAAIESQTKCPGPDCPFCSGEACFQCRGFSPLDRGSCEHDVIERHSPSAPIQVTKREGIH